VEKVRYMISDAAGIVGVESHVLRYWEEELELSIPRNEMGHRYYTHENILEFQKIRELKEKGYQLKAIKSILHTGKLPAPPLPDANASAAAPAPRPAAPVRAAGPDVPEATLSAEDRMAQFRELMSDIVGHAIAQNNDELSQNISQDVRETVLKEMNYLFREQEESQEERYKKLDAAIRGKVQRKRLFFEKKEKREKKQKASGDAVPTT
jgi:DNA-binding transcriptional MerR regulator